MGDEQRHEFLDHLLQQHISDEELHAVFQSEDGAKSMKAENSPLVPIFTTVPENANRPVSRRRDKTSESSLFESGRPAALLDMTFLCEQDFEQYDNEFPSSIWNCCTTMCFLALVMRDNLGLFYEIRRIKRDIDRARQVSSDHRTSYNAGSARKDALRASQERLEQLYVQYSSFLLGKEQVESVGENIVSWLQRTYWEYL